MESSVLQKIKAELSRILDDEEEMFDDRKGFAIMKRWSNRAIFIGAILVFLFLVYYSVRKNGLQ